MQLQRSTAPRHPRQTRHARRATRVAPPPLAAAQRGPNGINVGGFRPTSPAGWQAMRDALKAADVRLLTPQEAMFAQQRGVRVVDIRPEADYDEGHVPGAVSVPFYQPIAGWSPFQVARRVGYALFGVLNGTEVNPRFLQEVGEAVGDAADKGVVLYCAQGGSLNTGVGGNASGKGWQTRSLIAAHELVLTQRYPFIGILKGGWREWAKSGREVEVMEEAVEE